MRTFDTGATRDTDQNKLDYEGFLSPLVLRRYAEYMHKHRKQADGSLRDSDNWQKGMPQEAYRKSLTRHFFEAWQCWRAGTPKEAPFHGALEEILCAILFNVMGLLHELLLGRDVGAETRPAAELCAQHGHAWRSHGLPCLRCRVHRNEETDPTECPTCGSDTPAKYLGACRGNQANRWHLNRG